MRAKKTVKIFIYLIVSRDVVVEKHDYKQPSDD